MYQESLGRKIWRVISPVIAYILIYAVCLFAATLILQAMKVEAVEAAHLMTEYAAVITGVSLLVTIPVLYFFYYKRDYVIYDVNFFKGTKWILLLIALGITASHGLSLFFSLFMNTKLSNGYDTVETAIYASSAIIVIIRAAILAPICEELLFRGLIFRRMKEYSSFWPAAVISSIVFAIYHMNLIQGLYAFVFGLILCYVYTRFQNLFANIILHAAGNLLSVILTYSMFQYPTQVLYYIVMAVFLLITIYLIFFVFKKKEV